jgi:hypothetical protein
MGRNDIAVMQPKRPSCCLIMVLDQTIDRFISKIEMGRDFFLDAGRLLVEMVDRDPDILHQIIELKRVHWLTMDVLKTFEAIGRKQLAVEAMFLPPHVIARLIELPHDQQVHIAQNDRIPIVRHSRPRSTDIKRVYKSASRLTLEESRRVIGPNGLRTPTEQIKLLPKKETALGRFRILIEDGHIRIEKGPASGTGQRVKLNHDGFAVIDLYE